MGDQARNWRGQLRICIAAMLGGLAERIKSETSAPPQTTVLGTVHLKRDLLLSLAVTLLVGIPLYIWETKYVLR